MTTDMISNLYQPIKLFETVGGQVVVTRGTRVYPIRKNRGEYATTFAVFCEILIGDAPGNPTPDPYRDVADIIAEKYVHVATFHTDEFELEIIGIPAAAGAEFIGNGAQYDIRGLEAALTTKYRVVGDHEYTMYRDVREAGRIAKARSRRCRHDGEWNNTHVVACNDLGDERQLTTSETEKLAQWGKPIVQQVWDYERADLHNSRLTR